MQPHNALLSFHILPFALRLYPFLYAYIVEGMFLKGKALILMGDVRCLAGPWVEARGEG